MQSAYGIDLGRALWGDRPLSLRRLLALVGGLPRGGALDRALDPDGWGSGWTHTEELLATIAELLDLHRRQYVVTNSKRGASKPRAIKIPRPSDIRRRLEKIRKPTGEQLRDFLVSKGVVPARKGGGH